MNRLFVDNLTVIDFSYFHAHRGVVGESWIVDVTLLGELNEEGMVFDFGHVKKLLKMHWIMVWTIPWYWPKTCRG